MRGAAEIRRDCERLALQAEMEALICDRLGMEAKNVEQLTKMLPVAHSEEAFAVLAEAFRTLATKLREA